MSDITPGEIIDTADLDAKLVVLRLRGAPHFTGLDMAAVEARYHKSFSDLTMAEMQTATAYIYLRRAKGDTVTWEQAETQVTFDYEQPPDPTAAASSATWPPSANSGG